MISIIVLGVVFVLIVVRRVGSIRLRIWQIMLLGALAVLVSGQISPTGALRAIDPDVILFLFGVFVIGQALEESGYLSHISHRFFGRAKSLHGLVLLVLLGAAAASAFLMNDTLAVIGTPVMLLLARSDHESGGRAKVLLLALAFGVTIGSATSPIGNPQNLLIAIGGHIANPFITFFEYLLAPTVVNLILAYLLFRLFFRKLLDSRVPDSYPEPIKDNNLALLAKVSLAIMLFLVLVKVLLVFAGAEVDFKLTYIAVIAALPIIILSPKRAGVVRRIDWSTLVFFAAMFVLMQSVWQSGFFQSVISDLRFDITSPSLVLGAGVVLSQFISNVPMVALYLPILVKAGAATKAMMALAAGSTIAGNLTVIGAASNVIIIQNAEKKGNQTLTFWEFFRVGLPLTLLNAAVYSLFLMVLPR